MGQTTVNDVLAGRRFPFSRAFAQAGFAPDEAELWRRAGWLDPVEALPWRRIATAASPADLRRLFREGFRPNELERIARFAPTLTVAWARAFIVPAPTDPRSIPIEIDLREPLTERS